MSNQDRIIQEPHSEKCYIPWKSVGSPFYVVSSWEWMQDGLKASEVRNAADKLGLCSVMWISSASTLIWQKKNVNSRDKMRLLSYLSCPNPSLRSAALADDHGAPKKARENLYVYGAHWKVSYCLFKTFLVLSFVFLLWIAIHIVVSGKLDVWGTIMVMWPFFPNFSKFILVSENYIVLAFKSTQLWGYK